MSSLRFAVHCHLFSLLLIFSVCSFTTLPAQAQTLLKADEIVQSLQTPIGENGLVRAFRPRANPDASTRICDPAISRDLENSSGLRGEILTRDLYVESKPKVDLDIAFALGEAALLPAGREQLDALAQAINTPAFAKQRFIIAGHTDKRGERDYNDRLSCERALSARRYLIEKHRLPAAQLIPMDFGFDKLKIPNDPYADANRRVEIRVATGGN